MKYCLKCGTLLEDSHEICIGCGSDVTKPESWSLYPPEMAKRIEIENEEKKSQNKLIFAMIAVFVLLVAAVSVFIVFNINNKGNRQTEKPVKEEALAESEALAEATETAETPAKEEEASADNEIAPLKLEDAKEETTDSNESEPDREIKDANGKYYNIGIVSDAVGNEMFSTIYPEDFVEKNSGINYDVYSSRYPESLTYIVGNEDGNVQFTFMSPQHYWYRKSDYKGQTRSNERDVEDYMQFLTYSGAKGYIDAIIKQSYTDIKGFKLIDKEEFDPLVSTKIQEISDNHTKELLGDIGDYAKIGEDTVYAAMQAECEAYIYHYQATSRQNNTIYMDFYVPVIANTLGYVSELSVDKGEVTEWLIPSFYAFEAGNEELYNLYSDAFKHFIYNSKLSDEFFYINHTYSEEIAKAVNEKKEPERLSINKLKDIHSKFKPDSEINAFAKDVKSFIDTKPSTCTSFSGEKLIYSTTDSKVAFYGKEKNKVFISDSEDEYPGNDYVDLQYHEGSASEETSSDSEASADE